MCSKSLHYVVEEVLIIYDRVMKLKGKKWNIKLIYSVKDERCQREFEIICVNLGKSNDKKFFSLCLFICYKTMFLVLGFIFWYSLSIKLCHQEIIKIEIV